MRRILHVDLMIDKIALEYVGDWEFGSSTHLILKRSRQTGIAKTSKARMAEIPKGMVIRH